jgi:hypothetical protein
MSNPFDLSTLDLGPAMEQGREMKVRHPVSGAPLVSGEGEKAVPFVIVLAGRDSRRYRQAVAEGAKREADAAPPGAERTIEQARAGGIEILAAMTLSWSGFILDGKVIDCTPPNARLVYGRFDWLREQVDSFIHNRANFTTG